MHVCHCCVLPLPAVFPASLSTTDFFKDLHSTCRKNGQKRGFQCLTARFLNYKFSTLPNEWHWDVYVWTKYRTAMLHTAFVKRFWHTEVAHMSARVNPALDTSEFQTIFLKILRLCSVFFWRVRATLIWRSVQNIASTVQYCRSGMNSAKPIFQNFSVERFFCLH